MSTVDSVTGAFDTIPDGFDIAYNVDLGTDSNGIQLYGVQVTKKASSGLMIIVR